MISFLVDEDDRDFDHKQNKEKRNKKLRTTIESKEPRFNCHTVIIRERNDNLRIRRRKNKNFSRNPPVKQNFNQKKRECVSGHHHHHHHSHHTICRIDGIQPRFRFGLFRSVFLSNLR
ncbi:hypothetical protein SSS_10630 [Sarcoptes scabiei]|nr:hypothetical protein SSS_10630 [Sarcoptes scabiei]